MIAYEHLLQSSGAKGRGFESRLCVLVTRNPTASYTQWCHQQLCRAIKRTLLRELHSLQQILESRLIA